MANLPIKVLFENLLNQIKPQIGRGERISIDKNILDSLHYMFEDELMDALQMIDNKSVTILYSDNSFNTRQVFEVKGSESRVYYCLKNGYFCNCDAFQHQVLNSEQFLMCKHVLASKLAEKLEACRYRIIEQGQLIKILRGYRDVEKEESSKI